MDKTDRSVPEFVGLPLLVTQLFDREQRFTDLAIACAVLMPVESLQRSDDAIVMMAGFGAMPSGAVGDQAPKPQRCVSTGGDMRLQRQQRGHGRVFMGGMLDPQLVDS